MFFSKIKNRYIVLLSSLFNKIPNPLTNWHSSVLINHGKNYSVLAILLTLHFINP